MRGSVVVFRRRVFVCLATILLCGAPAFAGTIISDNFNDNALNTGMWAPFVVGNAAITESGGQLVARATGPNAVAALAFLGTIGGDFDIQVSYALEAFPSSDSNPSAALAMMQFSDVVFVNRFANTGGGFYGADVGAGQPQASTGDTSGRFRLARQGSVWTASYLSGATWLVLHTDNTLGAAAIDSLVIALVVEGSDSATVAFDDFSVEADQITTVPEPASLLMLGTGLIGLTRKCRRRR